MIELITLEQVGSYIWNYITQFFGLSGQPSTAVLVAIILFILLFVDFLIIFKGVTLFSSLVSTILALGLCMIATLSGIIPSITLFLTNSVGYFFAIVIIVGIKIGSSIFELMIAQKMKKDKKFKEKIEEEAGKKLLRHVGKKR
jgi:membrane-bound ClpP family serine protease